MGEHVGRLDRAHVMLAHVQEAVSIVDSSGRVVESTGRLRSSLGYPPSFWDDRTVIDLVVPEDAVRASRFRDSVLGAPGVPITDEFVVVDVTGGRQSVSVRVVNLFHDLDVGGIVLSVRNTTRQQALLDELRAARFRAMEQVEALRQEVARLTAERAPYLHAATRMRPSAPALWVDPVDDGGEHAVGEGSWPDGAVVHLEVLDGLTGDMGDRKILQYSIG